MSDWSAAGLPAPLANGFGQRTDRGLSRTPFATALPEQAVIRTRARRSLSLSFTLDGAQLASAEALLQAQGYQGFTLPLANLSAPAADCLVDTRVRLTADYQVSAIRPGLFQLTCEAETLLTPARTEELLCDEGLSIHVATAPYPFPVSDALASAARIVSGHLSPYAAEAYQSSHEFTAGSILQTRQFVPITMDPDAVSSAHVFTLGEIYATKTLAPLTMDPDAISSAHVFTAGEILTVGVLTTPNPETMTATALITGGTLE